MKHKQIFNKAKQLRIETSKKEAIKDNLRFFMKENPAAIVRYSRTRLFCMVKRYKHVPAIAILIIMLTAGTSIAAEGSLPGQTLYTIKTRVNERIKDLAHRSSESKVGLQARLIEERLKEVQALAADGQLNDKKKFQVEQLMRIRIGNFNQHLEKIASSSAYAAQADLYNKLSAHKEVVESLATDFENNENLGSIISQIQLMESQMRADAKLFVETQNASEIQVLTAGKIEKVNNQLRKEEQNLHAKAIEQAQRAIEESQKNLREGSILNDQGHATSAREILRNSEWAIERAEKILEIHKKIRLKNRIENGELIEREVSI